MMFIRLNNDTLEQGERLFSEYVRATVCGRGDQKSHAIGKARRGGVAALPGATVACLDSGILDHCAVICAVARATRCRQSTVAKFLDEFLTKPDDADAFCAEAGLALETTLLSSNLLIAA